MYLFQIEKLSIICSIRVGLTTIFLGTLLSLPIFSFTRVLLKGLGECSVDLQSEHENEATNKGEKIRKVTVYQSDSINWIFSKKIPIFNTTDL